MKNSTLTSLKGEDLDAAFAWIDWRSSEQEVIAAFADHLGDEWTLGFKAGDENPVLTVQGADYIIHLTGADSDRYIMLSSLAEIFRKTHVVWLHKGSMEDDTHGILVLSKDQSDELEERHAVWVEQHLLPLRKGLDAFNGLDIPYYGHEDNAPGFGKERQTIDQARADRQAKVNADAEKFLARYEALEKAANKKSLIARYGFPLVLAILALIAGVIAVTGA